MLVERASIPDLTFRAKVTMLSAAFVLHLLFTVVDVVVISSCEGTNCRHFFDELVIHEAIQLL
eukprot:scaffold665797_cov79-Prasinocladus_malaysianus.AAC.1